MFTITQPKNNAKFLIGEAVEISGTADGKIVRVDLTSDDQFVLPTVTLEAGKWTVANRFNLGGKRKVTAKGFDGANNQVASAEISLLIEAPDFGKFVPVPKGINKGASNAKQRTMLDIFGRPGALSEDCTPVTNTKVKKLLVTTDVGPFRVTGIKPAVDALKRVFAKVQKQEPELFRFLGTAGMLCCRRVRKLPGRPLSKNFSNHSWGTAVDIKIKGTLDPRANGTTQLGLLLLHPFFNEERFFWGAGFPPIQEDSMHFEASDELIRDWKKKGLLGS